MRGGGRFKPELSEGAKKRLRESRGPVGRVELSPDAGLSVGNLTHGASVCAHRGSGATASLTPLKLKQSILRNSRAKPTG